MNEYHRRHILSSLQHIDGQFAEIEGVMAGIGVESPLSQYTLDLQPMQRRVVEDFLRRIRREMASAAQRLGVPPGERRTAASWAIRSRLLAVSIAIAEMDPHHLRGYGDLTAEDKTEISRQCAELDRLIGRLEAYLRRAGGEDLSQRLARLDGSPANREVLVALEQIITRHHLLEFRPTLDMILSRLESTQFEIAFFGRVSSGKSSLLNHILGTPVLPIGATPVTAVPTRLRNGSESAMFVFFEMSSPQRLDVGRIAEFVTEEGNPNNTKHVSGVEVFLPSSRLAEGVTLVDTPGVGSLATCGAAQAMAYLPRCDLGVLLVDAASSLNHEDLAILQGLYDAAVPAMVLVSKCDLLNEADRPRVTQYIQHHVKASLGFEPKVYLSSTVGEAAVFTDHWFAEQVRPMLENHRQLAQASIHRKIANLRESVAHALASLLDRQQARRGKTDRDDPVRAAEQIEAAAAQIAKVGQDLCEPVDAGLSDAVQGVLGRLAGRLARYEGAGDGELDLPARLTLEAMAEEASAVRGELVELGRSLAGTLKTLSACLPGVRVDEMEDVLTILKPLPSIDQKALLEIPNPRRPLLLAWCPPLARWAYARRVRRMCRWAIDLELRNHRYKVRDWKKANLERLVEAYEARAGLYREQLRRLQDGDHADAREVADIRADLDRLSNKTPPPPEPPGDSFPAGESALSAITR